MQRILEANLHLHTSKIQITQNLNIQATQNEEGASN